MVDGDDFRQRLKIGTLLRQPKPKSAISRDPVINTDLLWQFGIVPLEFFVHIRQTIVYYLRTMSGLCDLFPKTRAEILHLLFETADREIHLRDLARLAGLSVAALQKELTSLAAKGFVQTRRDGNRLYYRANATHPLYPELHGLARKTSGLVGELRRALAAVDGIEFAFIFGSVGAGTHTANSDVDLLVLGSAGLRKTSAALSGLADTLGREINPVCLTPGEWREKCRSGDTFATRVLNEPKLWLKGGPDELAAMAS